MNYKLTLVHDVNKSECTVHAYTEEPLTEENARAIQRRILERDPNCHEFFDFKKIGDGQYSWKFGEGKLSDLPKQVEGETK